jgi:hypothetical protein
MMYGQQPDINIEIDSTARYNNKNNTGIGITALISHTFNCVGLRSKTLLLPSPEKSEGLDQTLQ